MANIGNNIMKYRKELGMTQEELASKMGYKSKSTINKIELGINDIPQSKVVKFAEALCTTPAHLMGWEEENGESELTAKDKRDIAKDLDRIMGEIKSGDDEPLYYNGVEIDDASIGLLRNAIEYALRETKKENKVKYNPNKNKK